MFGIDDALLWMPLAGAALGGISQRKNPLQGALLGGGAGLLGAAAAPSLLGAASAAPASAAAESAAIEQSLLGLSPTNYAPVADAVIKPVANAATTTMGQDLSLIGKNAAENLKPIGTIADSAMKAQQMFPGEKPAQLPPLPQAPAPQAIGTGPQALANLVQNNNGTQAQIAQQGEMLKQRKKAQIAQMGNGLLGVA